MRESMRLGTIAGVRVGLNFSVLVILAINRVRAALANRRAELTLSEIACPPRELPITIPEERLVELLPRLAGCNDARAVVVDDQQRVIGIVSPSDVSRAVQLCDLRPFDPYQGPRGADLSALPGSRT